MQQTKIPWSFFLELPDVRRLNRPINRKSYKLLCLSKNATCLLLSAGPASSASMNKSSTLPLPHRLGLERPSSSASRDREGYYSDRNELIRERERERDKERDRGYLSDHSSRYKKKISLLFVNVVMGWDFVATAASDWLLSIPRKSDEWTWSTGGIVIGLGKPKFSVKNTCSMPLCPPQIALGSNPSLFGEKSQPPEPWHDGQVC